jgi:hypothetical protein
MDSTQPQQKTAWDPALELLWKVVFLCSLVGAGMYGYRSCEIERSRWLTETLDIRDPWTRYSELEKGLGRWLTEEQEASVRRHRDAAFEEAVAAKDPAALLRLEEAGQYYPRLVEKYPRQPEQRESQLRGLRVMWPQLDAMPVTDRVSLLFMAERCHLHEAPQPFARPTILECVRTGARMLGDQQTLERLLVSAVLGAPLTR